MNLATNTSGKFPMRMLRSPQIIFGYFLLLTSYGLSVVQVSFWSDDYSSVTDSEGTFRDVLGDGRPIFAWITRLSFALVQAPEDSWILRLLSFMGLSILYALVVSKIESQRRYLPIIIALAFTLPSFQMYIMTAGCWSHIWACLFGVVSFELWGSRSHLNRLAGVLLVAISLAMYPPASLFIFPVIAVLSVSNERSVKETFRRLVSCLHLYFFGIILAICGALISLRILGINRQERTNIIELSDIPTKVYWLITRPLTVGFRPYWIDSPSIFLAMITALPLIVLFLDGMRRQSKKLNENFYMRTSVIGFLLVMALLPIVFSRDNQFEFRIVSGYCWGILVILLVFAVNSLENIKSPKFGIRFRTVSVLTSTLLIAVSIISVGRANINYEELFHRPYVLKTNFLLNEMKRCRFSSEILVVAPNQSYPTLKRLGVFSVVTDLSHGWVPEANIEILANGLNLTQSFTYFKNREDFKLANIDANCVIDLEDFRKLLIQAGY
jgi:hypothetical protein